MQAFTTVTGIAASLPMINIDTDMIIAKQFLKTIKRTGLGVHLFHDMRYDADGQEVADFVLNKEPFRNAQIWWQVTISDVVPPVSAALWSLLDWYHLCDCTVFCRYLFQQLFQKRYPANQAAAGAD